MQITELPKFNLSFFTEQRLLEISNGEVTDPETISYRTQRPIDNGLLCQKIFGPIKDYECNCSRYRGIRYKNVTCEECGVTVMSSNERFIRVGHISLIQPVVHPLAVKHIGKILQITASDVNSIAYAEKWIKFELVNSGHIVIKDAEGHMYRGRFVTSDEALPEYNTTAVALYDAVKSIVLDETVASIASDDDYRKLLLQMIDKNFDPTSYFVRHVLVGPAGYRSIVSMEGFYATSGRNELYQRILRRNIRLRTILEYGIDDKELLNLEQALLQKSIDTLFMGGMMESNGVPLSGVIEGFSGKGGLIRGNLLGKRMDYSGRSVITAGPNLRLDQIGLPYGMAYELFKPFVIRELIAALECTYKHAHKHFENRTPETRRALERAVVGRRVLMNRQPSLHRLSVMAFKVVLIHDKCIRVHPMVCAPFNADFDGDTVAIHVPLTDKAMREAEELLSCGANLLMSANGEPVMAPSHEMVIGLYAMTAMRSYDRPKITENSLERLKYIHDFNDPVTNVRALKIDEILTFIHPDGTREETCLGRLLIEDISGVKIKDFVSKSSIRKLIRGLPTRFSRQQCLDILDQLMQWSLHYATQLGFSVCIEDFKEPPSRKAMFAEANAFEAHNRHLVEEAEITKEDAYERNVRKWMGVIEQLQKEYVVDSGDDNPIVMMYKTGARVSMSQISQLTVAKGMIANMANKISEHPIENSLKDGLTAWDYFSSCSGSRKSLSDKKFITPKSGYLARRLITATRDLGITEDDCGSTTGVRLPSAQTYGRYDLEGNYIETPSTEKWSIVRSPVTCKAKGGICRKCYGDDPSTMVLVRNNVPVGAIAAQSLTEPTTQMTMRTFHTSGAATLHESNKVAKAVKDGVVHIDESGEFYTTVTLDGLVYYALKSSARLLVEDGDSVKKGQLLFGYVNNNLENEDIAGTLPKLEAYYELYESKLGEPAVVAINEGAVTYVPDGETLKVFVNEVFQGVIENNVPSVPAGQTVEVGDELSVGEVSIKSLFYRTMGNLPVVAELFVRKTQNLYKEAGIYVDPKHLEMVFRAMTEIVIKEDNSKGLRSFDQGTPILKGAIQVGYTYPSWLKAIGFGYIRSILVNALSTGSTTYGTRTEAIISGGRIPSVLK